MTAMLTHVTFRIAGEARELAAFDARLKALLAENEVACEPAEQHTGSVLHYDFKFEGGIPFPPFVTASGEFPQLALEVEWVASATGARGRARIERGALVEQAVENIAAGEADSGVAITLKENGYLALALAVVRTGHADYCGYALTGRQDALFRIARDKETGGIELYATQGAAEWSRCWRVAADGATEYHELDPVRPIADAEFRELEKLAQDFVAAWIWFGGGPREEVAIELERYAHMGYAVSDANLRSSALHRIKTGGNGGGALHYTTLAGDAKWVADAIARCWPGDE
jgi:hypothetical protein